MTDPPPSELALVLACQLMLYGLAWLVAAIRLPEPRRALTQWWLCSMLLALAFACHGGWLGTASNQHRVVAMMIAALAYTLGLRGMDCFLHGRPRHGPTMAIGLAACLAWLAWPGLTGQAPIEAAAQFGPVRALLLCGGTSLLAPEVRRQFGRSGLIFVAGPSMAFGALGLLSAWPALALSTPAQAAANWPGLPATVAILVAQTLLTFSQVFVLVSRLSRRIRHASLHDPLTGLANRLQAGQRMAFFWDYCQRSAQPLAVAMIDIDHFKTVNDSLGHAAGDAVLVNVAAALALQARSTDLVARYGGEEFLVLLPGTPPDLAMSVIERMRCAVETDCSEGGRVITISAGLTGMAASDHHIDDVVRRADKALYLAKASGRNRALRL